MATVKFKSALTGKYMTCPNGITADSLIYCQDGTPLIFEQGGDNVNSAYRVTNVPATNPPTQLYLSYRGSTGAMKLVADPSDAHWQITKQGNLSGIRNLAYNDYVWTSSSGEAYLTRHGDPTSVDSQWFVEYQ